jgi:predicted Fe-Mo cluster-binding NifX family protein
MKIAIASEGKNLDSEISEKGGRAPYYLVFENKKLIETIKNPFLFGGGAGSSVAYMLAEKNVKKVIVAGKIGDKMETALKEKGLGFEEKTGKVKEFI